jgi:hypothetical protein
VKDLLARAIAFVYWRCLREYLQAKFRITQATIGRALGVSTSNLSRWGKETLPEPSKTFLALVWQKVDVRDEELKFPPHHKNLGSFNLVLVEAMRLTIEQIRVREFGKKHAYLSMPMMKCAELLYKDEDSDVLLVEGPSRRALSRVAERLRRVFPREDAVSEKMVKEVASQWLLSYAFFDLGRPTWNFLREE